jgi:hypothetical protein
MPNDLTCDLIKDTLDACSIIRSEQGSTVLIRIQPHGRVTEERDIARAAGPSDLDGDVARGTGGDALHGAVSPNGASAVARSVV